MKITSALLLALAASLVAPGLLRSQETRLIDAVRSGDVRTVQAALKSGVDVNERDDTGGTALLYAAAFGSLETVRALLDAKADVNLTASEGATALIWASDAAKVRLLLDRGAAINAKAKDGVTALVSAAQRGNGDAVALLLSRGADPRASGDEGALLMQAGFASMNPQVRRLLAGAGLVPTNFGQIAPALEFYEAVDLDLVTRYFEAGGPPDLKLPFVTVQMPLLGYAAAAADLQTVQLVLDRGADPNLAATHDSTPLMLAAAAAQPDPAIVRLLLDRGAKVDARDEGGRSALDWALTQGDTEVVKVLRAAGARSVAPPAPAPAPAATPLATRQAVEKALGRMDTIGPLFFSRNRCISCHNQSLPAMARSLASARGVPVAAAVASHPDEATMSQWKARRDAYMKGRCGGGGFIQGTSYALVSMAEERTPRNALTDMAASCLATRQSPDGSWAASDIRPPLGGSSILFTALAARGLDVYTPPGVRPQFEPRLARARGFLQAAQARDTQDAAFKLLGLVWTKAPAAEISRQATRLRVLQRTDGGWGQWPSMAPDAYATGQALQALRVSGMPATDPVYRRGTEFLLRTQLADGTWFVRARGFGFQPYAEYGFPHGRSQFISAAATSWAVMALSHTL